MAERNAMRELSNAVCIVGADESDEIGTLPHKSQLALHLEAMTNAVRDAGLKITDVDGIFTAGQHSPAILGEALGITPRYVDGTSVGGCSFMILVEHAVAALHHHLRGVGSGPHAVDLRSAASNSEIRDGSRRPSVEVRQHRVVRPSGGESVDDKPMRADRHGWWQITTPRSWTRSLTR